MTALSRAPAWTLLALVLLGGSAAMVGRAPSPPSRCRTAACRENLGAVRAARARLDATDPGGDVDIRPPRAARGAP